ncbi:MAG: DUF3473 domain-containing protein [Gemmatimonadota bacterium]
MSAIRNVLTFDVEDWPQSTLDPGLPLSGRVVSNTTRILEMLSRRGIRATFFMLGMVAERFPRLARKIHEAGHEVASHGYDHRPVHSMTREAFRTDIHRSVRLLEEATGTRVLGYRAPDFSIPAERLRDLEVLAEEGLRYDSSIFPFAGPRYGIRSAFRMPHRVLSSAGRDFVEFPLATIDFFGLRIPAAGGGYFRLLPYSIARVAIRRLNAAGSPATVYFHPYEIDPDEIRSLTQPVPWAVRVSQGLRRESVERRLRRLLSEFAWGPARDRLSDLPDLTGGRVLDLTVQGTSVPRWLLTGGAE